MKEARRLYGATLAPSMKGTVTTSFAVYASEAEAAENALVASGFDARRDPGIGNEAIIVASQHYGTSSPDADVQRSHNERAAKALADAGVQADQRSTGVVVGGGTGSRWLQVYWSNLEPFLAGGRPLRILASDDTEASEVLDDLAKDLHVPRDELTVKPAEGWAGYT